MSIQVSTLAVGDVTHIRRLTAKGRKPGGGADTLGLCGAKVLWDTKAEFSPERVTKWNSWPYALCRRCKEVFEATL